MQKILSIILILVLLLFCAGAAAQDGAYENRVVFYDDDYLSAVASANGALYTMRQSGLYAVAGDGAETCVAAADAMNASIDILLSDGSAVYGFVSYGKVSLILLIDEKGAFVNRTVFETDAYQDAYTQNPIVADGKLYFRIVYGDKTNVAIYTLATGESKTVPLKDSVQCFDVMADGRLIVLERETRWPDVTVSLNAVSLETGESVLWAGVDRMQYLSCLTYDRTSETAYLFGRSDLFAAKEGGMLAPVDGYIAGDVMSAALLPSGAALMVDGILVIRKFAEGKDASRITVLDPYGRGEGYRSFLESNPRVDLQFATATEQTSEEKFVQDMISRNTDIDIYILSDLNLLKSIKNKGYFVDMAQSPEIQTLASQMYAPFRDALTEQGQIVAFPKEAFLDMLCYRRETFDELGVAPPKTYEAYFDFCLEWLGTYSEAYPDITLNPFAYNISLETLLARYADELARDGKPIAYRTEGMARVIEKYRAVEKAMADCTSSAYSYTYLFYDYFIPLLDETSDFAYLTLAFEEGNAAIGPSDGDFTYFVINPYGKNQQDALAFIAAYDANRSEIEKALLYETVDSAIESTYYLSECAIMQRNLDALEAALAKAEPDMVADLTAQIAEQKEQMASFEQTSRWAITEGALALYKAHTNSLYLSDFNPLTVLIGGNPNLLAEAENGEIASFLASLDSKIDMLLLENGMK